MKAEIETQLRKFIAENLLFSEEGFPVSDDESLLANGVIDSTGILELVQYVSDQFGFEVPVKEINQDNFDSITRLADYIRRRQSEREPRNRPQTLPTELAS